MKTFSLIKGRYSVIFGIIPCTDTGQRQLTGDSRIQVQGGTGLRTKLEFWQLPCQNLIHNAHLSKLSFSYFEIPLISTKMALLLTFPYLVSVSFTLNTSCVNLHAVSRCPLICTAHLLSLSDLKDRNIQRKWQNSYVLVSVIPSTVTV